MELLGIVIGSNVTIMAGAFALLRRVASAARCPEDNSMPRIMEFIAGTERALVEASRIQHTQSRYLDDLRQEISALRSEIGELKGLARNR